MTTIRLLLGLLLLIALPACGPDEETGCTGDEDEDVDEDGDGYCAPIDCDDGDPAINPGATEICNEIDDNCNDGLNEDELSDEDGDGSVTCLDCDDLNPDLFPGSVEACDGLDNDCDGQPGDTEGDADGDGWMNCADCDADDGDIHPGAPELECDGIDNNCDEVLHPDELDDDGDGSTACAGDCAPENAAIHPNADELCNGIDDDCDGVVPPDELDVDADGVAICDGDCEDEFSHIHPGADEVCNGIDDNCDGVFFDDADGGEQTDEDSDGFAPCMGDCDDGEPTINPSAYDLLDTAIDANCDGLAGGENPGLELREGPESDLLDLLHGQCNVHGKTVHQADFEAGPDGSPVGLSQTGLSFLAEYEDTLFGFAFEDDRNGVGPYTGSLFGSPEAGIGTLTVAFDSPQTLVIVTLHGHDSTQWEGYTVALSWDEASLLDEDEPFFGSQPTEVWTQRGLQSLNNVAFDQLVLSVSTPPEILLLDDLYYCR